MDKKKLLRLLAENGRITAEEIAAQLGENAAAVAAAIRKMEEEKTIIGYRAMFDESILPENAVKALIEVKIRPEREGGFDKIAKRLSKFGIKATPFSRLKGQADNEFNNRSHRKITVIDGKIGYTGGINIADEYVNEIKRFGHWKDVGVRLSRP